jgi:hypothetical protein
MSGVFDFVTLWGPLTVTGLIIVLNLMAPLTKSELDNKLLVGLRWFQAKALAFVLPAHKRTLHARISSIKIPQGVDPDQYVADLVRWYEARQNTPASP